MVDMYKLAQDQATDVKKMVSLLEAIARGLEAVCSNQVDIHNKLEEIENRLEVIEDRVTDVVINTSDIEDEDQDFFTNEDVDDGCDCDFCNPTFEEEDELEDSLTREELEELAFDIINNLTSQPQLPNKFYGVTLYEYQPNKSTPIKIEVNEDKLTVVALMLNRSGKVVKVGKARCMPDDDFSPYIGAAIAVHRLFELEVPEFLIK